MRSALRGSEFSSRLNRSQNAIDESPKKGKEIRSKQPKMHIIIIIIHTNRPKVGKNCLAPSVSWIDTVRGQYH